MVLRVSKTQRIGGRLDETWLKIKQTHRHSEFEGCFPLKMKKLTRVNLQKIEKRCISFKIENDKTVTILIILGIIKCNAW